MLSVKKDCWWLLMTRAEGRPRTTTFRSCDVHPPQACVLTCGWAPAIFAAAVYVPTLPQACYSTIAWKSNPCTTRVLSHQILLSLSRVQCVAIGPDHHFFISGGLTRNNDCNHDLLLHQMLFEEPPSRKKKWWSARWLEDTLCKRKPVAQGILEQS